MSELCLLNVYLPYCSRANTDEFLSYLGKLRQLCEELQCPNISFVGNFNAGATNTFGGLLEDFCMENVFFISDYALLPQDTFTYINDAHNTTSWKDNFVSSFSVHQAMFSMDVLTECTISEPPFAPPTNVGSDGDLFFTIKVSHSMCGPH